MLARIFLLTQALTALASAYLLAAANYVSNKQAVFNSTGDYGAYQSNAIPITSFTGNTAYSSGKLAFKTATVVRPVDHSSNIFASLIQGQNATYFTIYSYWTPPNAPAGITTIYSITTFFGTVFSNQQIQATATVPTGTETLTFTYKAEEITYSRFNPQNNGTTVIDDRCFALTGSACA